MKKNRTIPVENKSWQTSHLGKLQEHDIKALLNIMRAWFHQQEYRANPACNWQLLLEYLDRHGLSGLAGSLCLDGLGHFPSEIEEMATDRYFTNQLFYEQARRSLDKVQAAARELRVPAIVLKGPAVIFQGYVDPGTRYFSDIDIFTDSFASYNLLLQKLEGQPIKASINHSWLRKLQECECASFSLDGWEMEFRYPLDPPGEPMFDVLLGNRDRLQKIPESVDDILNPDPSAHLVFLIQHMSVNHLLSRFFWFLDLAVLVRHCRDRIDFARVAFELDRIGQTNAAAVAADFCRAHIDPDFPVMTPKLPAWNFATLRSLAVPAQIANGRYGIYHQKLRDRFLGYFFSMMSFYFIEDPKRPFYTIGFGTHWIMYRMKRAAGIEFSHPLADIVMGSFIRLFTYPLARFIALFINQKTQRPPGPERK